MEEVSEVLRLNARPTAETESRLLKVEVEAVEDLMKLAKWLDAPITKDREGNDAVIDARDLVLYFVRRWCSHAHES
jgi:hypothetical protein